MSEPIPVPDRSVQLAKQGLSAAERETLTLRELRTTRLIALVDGEPLVRAARDCQEGKTTAPTIEFLAGVLSQRSLSMGTSTWRTFEAGTAEPRLTVSQMEDLAEALGLSLDELAAVCRNTMLARVQRMTASKVG